MLVQKWTSDQQRLAALLSDRDKSNLIPPLGSDNGGMACVIAQAPSLATRGTHGVGEVYAVPRRRFAYPQ